MLRWKSSLKPTAASGGIVPVLLGGFGPSNNSYASRSIDISSATDGALLFAAVTARSVQPTLAVPSGWTLLTSADNGNSSSRPYTSIYYKTAGASETTVVFNFSPSEYVSGVAFEIAGANTSTFDTAANTSSDVLGVVTVPTGGIVIGVHGKGDNADTLASTFSNGSYTILSDRFGTRRSGTAVAWADLGSGDTNGTDTVSGAGATTKTCTLHVTVQPAAADYSSAVLADSPSAYWQLDESSGTTLADSAGSYDLTLTGSYSLNQPSLAGSSASVDFTGGHAAGANQGPDLSSTDYTLELVTKLDSTQSNWTGLISSGDAANNWAVQRNSGTGDLRVYHGNIQSTFTGEFSSIADDSSHHLVITYINSSKTVELWIDGVSQGTLTHTAHPDNNTGYTLRLAASRDPVTASGIFDEAAIYTSKLSDATISAHYDATNI